MYPESFEKFWTAYPPRWNGKKWKKHCKLAAYSEWTKLDDDEKEIAIEAAWEEERSKYTCDARKWLHHHRWEDETIDGSPPIEDDYKPETKMKLFPIPGKFCCKCKLPAKYKAVGAFDNYYCEVHMPENVKEKYE